MGDEEAGDGKAGGGMDTSNGDLRIEIGNLSCTLEGFDDPVEAMAAISDYLRALEAREAGGAPVEIGALRRILELARGVKVAEAVAPEAERASGPDSGSEAGSPPEARSAGRPAPLPPPGARTARPRTEAAPVANPDDEAVLARFLSEADRHLAAPEARRRRDALARLKAAFASFGRRETPPAEPPRPQGGPQGIWAEPFRDDLREAVRRAPGPPERR